jgi:hypothetical protein
MQFTHHAAITFNQSKMKNQNDIIQDVLAGMVGIGGIPSNEEFYAEFDMRVREALGIDPENRDLRAVDGLLPIRPDFSGEIFEENVQVDLDDLKKCGWDYAKKWLEEVREEKHQWANAFHNLKRALEGNGA